MSRQRLIAASLLAVALVVAGCAGPGTGDDNATDGMDNESDGVEATEEQTPTTTPADNETGVVGNETGNDTADLVGP